MSITLTYNGTTAHISDRLQWTDEYSWSPVDQATAYSTTGALLVDVALKQAGRPITLVGTDSKAWISRALCDTLQAWAALPGIELDLVLRGATRHVLFDHAQGGFAAQPMWRIQDSQIRAVMDGEIDADLLYLPTFKFIEI
ncbi:hypothetical protein [Paracidovorax anthurii]|uniref:Uncharacterized protein n=1 Tax=Paracidovorax anthurii TaxID=78229 RepID=A0A328ZUW4_9BURK|nr:hypothetical protein [Paracidovorax anthurii]RAR86056.1 hypothetical protein AX018_100217 [Paracidovorax anthurii]